MATRLTNLRSTPRTIHDGWPPFEVWRFRIGTRRFVRGFATMTSALVAARASLDACSRALADEQRRVGSAS